MSEEFWMTMFLPGILRDGTRRPERRMPRLPRS